MSALTPEVAPNEVTLSRVIAASRERVFAAWVDPKQMAAWWAPAHFTNPVCEMDPRPGGAYRIVMRAPDGAEYPLSGEFREVSPPDRLVMTMRTEGKPPLKQSEMVLTVTFEAQGAGTKLTIVSRFPSDVERDTALEMGMAEGWSGSLEKLEALVGG